MPAYNAELTLKKTYDDLPHRMIDQVILVDDASTDNTADIAGSLGLTVVRHPQNRGYGGNQKTCYHTALANGGDIMIMVHPDHQYDPRFIPEMIRLMNDENCPAVFGSRMINRKDAIRGGMPYWKLFFNIILTKIGNLMLGTKLSEFHSGFRAYHRRVFEQINIDKNSDNFVFDTQIIIQLVEKNIPIKEIPISTRYFKEASQIKFLPCIRYGLGIIGNVLAYRSGLKKFN